MIWLYIQGVGIFAHIPLQIVKALNVKSIHLLNHSKEDVSKNFRVVASSVVIEFTKIIILCNHVELMRFKVGIQKS